MKSHGTHLYILTEVPSDYVVDELSTRENGS